VLITTESPVARVVYVFSGDAPVCRERCSDADDAAAVGQRLWNILVDGTRR
jgi:hypothetical protein